MFLFEPYVFVLNGHETVVRKVREQSAKPFAAVFAVGSVIDPDTWTEFIEWELIVFFQDSHDATSELSPTALE